MKSFIFAALFVLATSISAIAQGDLPIYGELTEIKGKTKVYVSGATSDQRKNILEMFKHQKTFAVVNDPAEAEFFMNFGELSRQVVAAPRRADYQQRDEAQVYYVNGDSKKVVVWQDTETLDATDGLTLSMPNEINLVKNFFEAYQKATKEKIRR